jgi:hypothetical protein
MTGPPGAGKTVALTALIDAPVADEAEHAAVDVEEVGWSHPFPSLGSARRRRSSLGRLEARLAMLRQRIVAREPPGWFGLECLLEEAESLHSTMPELDGVHLVLDTERLGSAEIADRIRSVGPDELSRGSNGPAPAGRPLTLRGGIP